jgi:hypothetical protein
MDKFYPPRLTLRALVSHSAQEQVDMWLDNEIYPLFDKAVEVHLHTGAYNKYYISESAHPNATHTGLLINIQPIKEDTAESILRELFDHLDKKPFAPFDEHWHALDDRARRFFKRKCNE